MEKQCPIPISQYPTITMAHGGGGRLTQMLIEQMFVPTFDNTLPVMLHDGAWLQINGSRIAFTTDSYTISPLCFPGGTIGSLAVHGTVNDLAMCGAQPLALSTSFILEEGLPMETLWHIVQTMQQAAEAVGVPIVTGDTKVVERNKCDGIFINTTGVGYIDDDVSISPNRAKVGDVVLVSGAIAVHGIAIMSLREGLEFETTIESDSAPLHEMVARILAVAGQKVHVLRDPTRGGISSTLNEIAAQSQVGIYLEESSIPIWDDVRGACELLGLDPLYVANEGKCIVIAAPEAADVLLSTMRFNPLGKEAAIIGHVTDDHPGRVVMRSRIGGKRIVDMLSGEQLPRIC